MAMSFQGFPADTVRFLSGLASNNNRDWFRANKARYERSVRGPALAFIEAMAGPLERVSRHIYADPSPSGGSRMRIYRDTRFSPDKSPYKTNIGIQFRHERCDDIHASNLIMFPIESLYTPITSGVPHFLPMLAPPSEVAMTVSFRSLFRYSANGS